jgi:hypothetical protein
LMVIYFLVVSCLHNGGTVERFFVWRVDGNENVLDFVDEFSSNHQNEDEEDNEEPIRAQIQRRNAERRRILLKYFEQCGHLQVVRISNGL